MNKDWVGNSNSVYKTLGASNHCKEDKKKMIIMQQIH